MGDVETKAEEKREERESVREGEGERMEDGGKKGEGEGEKKKEGEGEGEKKKEEEGEGSETSSSSEDDFPVRGEMKMVLLVRTDLGMTKGKMYSQVCEYVCMCVWVCECVIYVIQNTLSPFLTLTLKFSLFLFSQCAHAAVGAYEESGKFPWLFFDYSNIGFLSNDFPHWYLYFAVEKGNPYLRTWKRRGQAKIALKVNRYRFSPLSPSVCVRACVCVCVCVHVYARACVNLSVCCVFVFMKASSPFSEQELLALWAKALEYPLISYIVADAGRTQVRIRERRGRDG